MKKLKIVARICAASFLALITAYAFTAQAASNASGTMYSSFQNFFLPSGIMKKLNRTGVLPPGISLKVFLTGSSSTSTSPGNMDLDHDIYRLTVANVTENSAEISWTTLTPASSKVTYSTSALALATNGSGVVAASSSVMTYFHTMRISNLASSTKYYFNVSSTDASGHTAVSSVHTFSTTRTAVIMPVAWYISASATSSTTERITWQTNTPATSLVWYGTSTPASLDRSLSAGTTTPTVLHEVNLTGLTPSTFYWYTVVSANASGTATSTGHYFYSGR